jgi:UTP--glucose-1-phosphate uridylyltransferase
MKSIKTAVFPVAGLGTRFLPVTKTGPKEMLPIVDKPLVQYVVEEALAAGIEQLIFVTNNSKYAIEDYFDRQHEYERRLEQQGKLVELEMVRNIVPSYASVVYIRQSTPAGLGDAVLRAKHVVGQEPFAVLLADDIIDSPPQGCLQQMTEIFAKTQSSVIAVEQVPPENTDQYGIAKVNDKNQILDIIEKPKPDAAPSCLGVVGRYILTPRIFSLLEQIPSGIGGEIQLTDAIAELLKEEKITAFAFTGKRYDCGSKLGFLEATISYALRRPDLGPQLRERLYQLLELTPQDGELSEGVIL